MPNVIQTNISAGKIGKKIRGRIDNPKFLNGLDECKDFIPFIQGGGTRRPGTVRISDSIVSFVAYDNGRMIGISVDDTDDYYFLDMGAGNLRVLRSDDTATTVTGAQALTATDKVDIVATLALPYTDTEIPDVYVNAIGRDQIYFTHKNHEPRVLETIGWTLSTVPFTSHPYVKLDDTNTELKITNESEIIALSSDATENWATAHTAASNDFNANVTYIEYKVDNEYLLGRCLDSNTTPAATDPTASKIYIDPVEAVVVGLDPSARMVAIGSADADADNDEFRSNALVWNYDMKGAYVRIASEYDQIRDTTYADGEVKWGKVSEYLGGKDVPTKFLSGAVTFDDFDLAHVYKITTLGTLSVTVAAPVDKTLPAPYIDWTNGFTYTTLGDQFSWQNHSRVNASSSTTRLDDMSSLKTFDVVEVEAFLETSAGATSDRLVLQPTGNITVLDKDTDTAGTAAHSATITASRTDTFKASTNWATTTAYVVGDYRYDSVGGISYECVVAHTSGGGTFAAEDQSYWKANDMSGRFLQLQFGNDWVTVEVTTITSDTVIQVEVLGPIPRATNSLEPTAFVNDGQTSTWRKSAWGIDDYPHTVTFYEQRIIFGGNPTYPHYFWASKLEDNFDFRIVENNGEVLDTTAITYPLSSTDLAAIKWMQPGPTLVIGTEQKEWQVKPNSFGQALTQTNIRITSETEIGSESRALRAGSSIFFIERGGRGFRELYFDFSVDGFRTRDLLTLSDDILGDDTIIDFAYQKFPNQLFWVVTSSGKVLSFTYDSENNFYSWAEHGITTAKAVGVAPRTGANYAEDAVWFSTSTGGSVTGFGTVWALSKSFQQPVSPDGYNGTMMFLDNATWFSEDNGDTVSGLTGFTGLSWLAGFTVGIVIDGVYRGTQQVDAFGTLTLPVTAEYNVAIGFIEFNSVHIKTLPHASAGVAGPNWGRNKRFRKVFAYMLDSMGGLAGDGVGTAEEIKYLNQETLVHGQTPLFFTGFKELDYDWVSDVDPRVEITTNKPYPLTILSLGYEMESNE